MSNIDEFFNHNEVLVEMIKRAALKTTDDQPFVTTFLSHEDRWHVMNLCMNRISSIFGPFHVFFNEARRCKSHFRSAWYLFTISSAQNKHRGRFFVTPYKPVLSRVDVGVRRLRIELVNEQEMREICAGTIKEPEWGFFNNRHRQRWNILQKMSELFENQLVILNDTPDPVHPSSPGMVSRTSSLVDHHPFFPSGLPDDEALSSDDGSENDEDSPIFNDSWATIAHEPSHLSPSRHTSNPRELAMRAIRSARRHESMCKETDNSILRVHIPYPSSIIDSSTVCETHAKDVVLFE